MITVSSKKKTFFAFSIKLLGSVDHKRLFLQCLYWSSTKMKSTVNLSWGCPGVLGVSGQGFVNVGRCGCVRGPKTWAFAEGSIHRCIPWKCFDDISCFVASRGLSGVEYKSRAAARRTIQKHAIYCRLPKSTDSALPRPPRRAKMHPLSSLTSVLLHKMIAHPSTQIKFVCPIWMSVWIGIPMNVPPIPCPVVGGWLIVGQSQLSDLSATITMEQKS